MDWTHADAEVQGCIDRLRDDQRAQAQLISNATEDLHADRIQRLRDDQRTQVQVSEGAAVVERRATDAAEDARKIIEQCRQRLREDAEEIDRLERERV
jgi:hypothetical protein